MRTLTKTIAADADNRTVLSLLRHEFACSDAHISRLKRREEGILLNGARCYVTARVRAGDVLTIEIGDLPDGHIVPMAYALDVRYEDDDLLILNKPAGIAVHQSTRDPEELTLENAVCHHLGGCISPHPVSRLDRGTSGLIAFAKSGYIHERLRRQMHTADYERAYLAVATGHVEPPSGEITLPIGMAEGSTYQRAIREDGQPARTKYMSLAQNERFTLLRLLPHTGRTHQLRLHMAALGYPLAGDWLYGAEDRALIARPALHSHELTLTHPVTGERIHLVSDLPEDMRRLMDLPDEKREENEMTIKTIIKNKRTIAIVESDEVLITNVQSALDLMATVRYETDTDVLILPKAALDERFFVLSSGLAGDILQKFVNYQMKVAIVGDYSGYTSKPLRDFIYESNNGTHVFFLGSEAEAIEKLSRA